jgi:FkbM family methyltransferase
MSVNDRLQRLSASERELGAKRALESAMQSEPDDPGLRTLYFQHLGKVARTHMGLCEVRLPELPHPLMFRCGTSDIHQLEQIFFRRAYDFLRDYAAPARILDLGASGGYAAVFLANRFPDAQILCADPVPSSFRLLLLNTLPYRNITHLNAAAWRHNGRVRLAGISGGHSGYQFADPGEGGQGEYRCFTVAEILRLRGWDRAEFVKCAVQGAEAALLADPTAEWLRNLDILAIETRDMATPHSIVAWFDNPLFTHARHRDLDVFHRRGEAPPLGKPTVIPLIHSGAGLSPMIVHNAPAADWGFFLYDDSACQLHPNPPGEPPAQMLFRVDCSRQNRFTTVVLHAGHPAGDIIFRVRIRRLADDAIIADSARRVLAGAGAEWSERIPVLIGPHEIVLETEMAEGAGSNSAALARWIDTRLS